MVCVAVTRGGSGDLWRLASVKEASNHPIVQYGDAICGTSEDVMACFSPSEMSELAGRLGNPALAQAIAAWKGRISERDRSHYGDQLWKLMRDRASEPPSDPGEIVRIIRSDRVAGTRLTYRLHPQERGPLQSKEGLTMSEENTKNVRAPRYADTAVISLGTDKDGKSYGADNNPKRAGSKSHDRFAAYKDGMTVAEAKAAGITASDLAYDAKNEFISIS